MHLSLPFVFFLKRMPLTLKMSSMHLLVQICRMLSWKILFSQFLYTSSVYVSHSYLDDFKIEITRCKSCNIDYIDGRHTLNGCGDGNFAPPYLTCPSPLCTSQVFPAPQKWWGRDGTRFLPHTMGRGGDGFRLFRPAPSCLSPPHIVKSYNCKFFIF